MVSIDIFAHMAKVVEMMGQRNQLENKTHVFTGECVHFQ